MSDLDKSDTTYETKIIAEVQRPPSPLSTNHKNNVYLNTDSAKNNSDQEMNTSRKKRLTSDSDQKDAHTMVTCIIHD